MSLVQLTVLLQRFQLGSEPASGKDEHTTRFALAFQCEGTRRNVIMFALGWCRE